MRVGMGKLRIFLAQTTCVQPVLKEPDPHKNGELKSNRITLGPGVWY